MSMRTGFHVDAGATELRNTLNRRNGDIVYTGYYKLDSALGYHSLWEFCSSMNFRYHYSCSSVARIVSTETVPFSMVSSTLAHRSFEIPSFRIVQFGLCSFRSQLKSSTISFESHSSSSGPLPFDSPAFSAITGGYPANSMS